MIGADLGAILKLAHALVGVWFISGLIGRWVALAQAARASDLVSLRAALAVSARFERVVIAGSVMVLLLGVVTAVAQGRPFLGPLQGAPADWLFVALLIYLSAIPLVPLVFLPRGKTPQRKVLLRSSCVSPSVIALSWQLMRTSSARCSSS